jgi:hypothetical protein
VVPIQHLVGDELLLVGDKTVVKRCAMRAVRTAGFVCVFATSALAADAPRQILTWPPAPQNPRIIYRHAFSRASDLGWDRAWWRKVMDWIKDERDPSLLVQPYSVAFDGE